jgi:iron complex outermembrane receptor protein
MNNHSARNLRAALCVCASASLVSIAAGQAASSGPAVKVEDRVKLDSFIVTGSNIPTAVDAVSVPVTMLGRPDLEQTGLDTNLLEVLQKRMPIFAGNGNLGVTNSNVGANSTYGGSNVSLRNLSTLVLLDGRRVPDNGANARGGRSFVDVNQIPLAAVQTVEVLTDGASAIYGADAVGGVVNVKLRSDFNGLEFGGRYAMSNRKGDYSERSGYFVAGVNKGGIGLTVSFTESSITPLYQADRPFSTPIVGRTATISGAVAASSATFPTNFLRTDLASPSRAVPTGTAATAADLAALQTAGVYTASAFQPIADTFDLSPLVTLTLESKKRAGTLAFSAKLIPDHLEMFVQGMVSESKSFSQLAAQPVTATVPINSPYNPTRSSIFAAFRYIPNPRQFINNGELKRIVTGFRGKIGDRWQWEAAYNYNINNLTNYVRNVLYNPNLQLAIAGGYDAQGNALVGGRYARVYRDFGAPPGTTTLAAWQAGIIPANSIVQPALDIFARPAGVEAASIANIFGSSFVEFDSILSQLDARVSGTIWDLPAGPLGLAVGLDYRTERLRGEPDVNSYSSGPTAGRWSGATFFNPFTKLRNIDGAFAEVRIPITGERMNIPGLRLLELSAAYRMEDYSDAGQSKVPKYRLRWRPLGDDFTVRATMSEAFSAPSLFSLFGPTTQGFTATAVIPNVFGVNGQAQARGGSNANLKPSTADTWSVGAVWSPKFIKGLTLSVDLIDIDQVQLVGSAGSTEILRSVNSLGTASPYAAQVAIGNWPTNPDPLLPAATRITSAGQLGNLIRAGTSANQIFLTDSNINIAGQKVRALDVAASYAFPATDYGRFNVTAQGTFFIDYKFQALPSQPYFEYAGHITNGGTGAQGSTPGMRWFTGLSWRHGNWAASLSNTHIDSMTDIGPGGITYALSTTLRRNPVSSYSTFDASLSHDFKNLGNLHPWLKSLSGVRVTAGVNNLADKMPIKAPQAYNESNADVSTYSPIGRLWYIRAGIKF